MLFDKLIYLTAGALVTKGVVDAVRSKFVASKITIIGYVPLWPGNKCNLMPGRPLNPIYSQNGTGIVYAECRYAVMTESTEVLTWLYSHAIKFKFQYTVPFYSSTNGSWYFTAYAPLNEIPMDAVMKTNFGVIGTYASPELSFLSPKPQSGMIVNELRKMTVDKYGHDKRFKFADWI